MRILHTSDLHLGKRTERVSRLPEQIEVLEEIVNITRDEGVGLVLIAGDVFDTATPSGDAEEAFYDFVCQLSSFASVAIIAGNHDDASKLCASSPIASRSNIHFLNEMNASRKVLHGTGFIGLNVGNEVAIISYLPYPIEGRIMRELGETVVEGATYSSNVGRWLSLGAKAFSKETVNLGMSHLFVSGSVKSGDEAEIELGTARLVGKDDLPNCDYLALGHVHRQQKVSSSKNAYYSGAILQYSFGDIGTGMHDSKEIGAKSVQLVTASAGKPAEVRKVPLSRGKRLVRIEANSVDEADELCDRFSDSLVELTINLSAPLLESQSKQLAKPNVLKRRLVLPDVVLPEFAQRATKTAREIFVAYYKSRYKSQPSEELIALFLEMSE